VLIKLQSVVVADRKVCGTYNRKQMNLLYRGEVIVDKLGRLRGPAIFVVNNSTEVYVGQKMQRSVIMQYNTATTLSKTTVIF